MSDNRDIVTDVKAVNSDSYFNNIRKLHKQFSPAKESYAILRSPKTVNLEFHAGGFIGSGRRVTFMFPKLESSKFVYCNLRLKDSKWNNVIRSCELELAGARADKVYGKVLKTLRYVYGIKDETVLPFSFCRDGEYLAVNKSDVRLNIEFDVYSDPIYGDDFELLVDVYSIENGPYFNPVEFNRDRAITQLQFTGTEITSGREVEKFKLDFNYLVNFLIVSFSNNRPEKIDLLFNGHDTNINLENMIQYDDHYIIPFTPSLDLNNFSTYGIDFSKIDNPQLNIWLENKSNTCQVCIYAVNYNTFNFMNHYC